MNRNVANGKTNEKKGKPKFQRNEKQQVEMQKEKKG